jgi:hypothetical protein
MKKIIFLILGITLIGFMSFSTKKSIGGTIHVYVKNSYGSPYNYARVNYDVCSTLSCAGSGNDVRTDKNGYAQIKWTTNCKICIIYVNGKAHKGTYNDGGTYTITSND